MLTLLSNARATNNDPGLLQRIEDDLRNGNNSSDDVSILKSFIASEIESRQRLPERYVQPLDGVLDREEARDLPPDTQLAHKEAEEDLYRCLAALPEQTQSLVLERYMEDKTLEEIGKPLGKSRQQVHRELLAACKLLAESLKKHRELYVSRAYVEE